MIIFGGFDGVNVFNDVWVLSNANGSGGTPVWTQLSPSGAPPAARTYHGAAYNATTNATTNRMTIFGGQTSTRTVLGDTWVLSNANGLGGTPAWTQLGAFVFFPETRSAHTVVYNPQQNKMTVFSGGLNASRIPATNNVWVLSHADGL
jgi:hypothetical protein